MALGSKAEPIASGNPPPQTICKKRIKRPAGDLRDYIPYRHIEDANRDRPFAVSSRLFIPHEDVPDLKRVEVAARLVEHSARVRRHKSRHKAVTQGSTRRIAAIRVEAEADDRCSIAYYVCNKR